MKDIYNEESDLDNFLDDMGFPEMSKEEQDIIINEGELNNEE